MGRKAFMFHEEWAQVLSSLPPEMRHTLTDALIEYFLTGVAPTFTNPALGGMFTMLKTRMDADEQYYEEKCEKLRANASKRKQMQANANECKQSLPNASKCKQMQANDGNINLNSNLNTNLNSNLNDDVNIILSQRPSIVEAIQRKFKITQEQVIQYANQFNDHCRIGLTTHKNEQDHLQHFRDWLKIQIQEQKKHGTNNSTSYEQRASEASELVAELLAKCDEVRNEGGVPIDF